MRKIALISDIHGNLQAFQAVLSDIKKRNISEIIFLGDATTLGPQPNEVIALLQQLKCLCICGNHDAFVTGMDDVRTYTDQPEVITLVDWCASILKAREIDFLRSFLKTASVSLGFNRQLLCFHGSPKSYNDNIYPDIPENLLEKQLQGYPHDVIACGHTHLPFVRRHFNRYIVNVGSVGAAFGRKPINSPPQIMNRAEYAIVSVDEDGPAVQIRSIAYDMKAFRGAVSSSDMPGKENWLDFWVE